MTDLKPASNYRPYLWWVAALAWGVANILFHKQANDVARRLVVVMGLQVFLWSTRAAFLGGAVFVLVFRRNFYRDSQIFKRLLIFVPLAAALDLGLVIYPSERIHYLQYAVLTWLAYKATGQAFPAALMSFIFGYVDEANQHWMLYANDPTAYFDWNDIVLNLIAALAGLVLLPQAARVSNLSNLPTRTIAAAAAAWALGISLLVFLLNPDPYLMRNQKGDSFWRKSGVETHYHVLTASEGAILLGVILIITGGFYWPDRHSPPRRGGVDAPSEAKAQTGWRESRTRKGEALIEDRPNISAELTNN